MHINIDEVSRIKFKKQSFIIFGASMFLVLTSNWSYPYNPVTNPFPVMSFKTCFALFHICAWVMRHRGMSGGFVRTPNYKLIYSYQANRSVTIQDCFLVDSETANIVLISFLFDKIQRYFIISLIVVFMIRIESMPLCALFVVHIFPCNYDC